MTAFAWDASPGQASVLASDSMLPYALETPMPGMPSMVNTPDGAGRAQTEQTSCPTI